MRLRPAALRESKLGIGIASGALSVWIVPAMGQMNCQTAITDFRFVVTTETSMGHVKRDRKAAALAELDRIQHVCAAGRSAEVIAALQAPQRRMGFR